MAETINSLEDLGTSAAVVASIAIRNVSSSWPRREKPIGCGSSQASSFGSRAARVTAHAAVAAAMPVIGSAPPL